MLSTILPHLAQPLFMHIDPDRILIAASRQFAQIEPHRIQRFMDAAVVADEINRLVKLRDGEPGAFEFLRDARAAFVRTPLSLL